MNVTYTFGSGMMGFGYKRSDLQKIAQAKLDDALLLLGQERFSNAYYLAGYAVEIGLKACIAKQVCAETIPDKEFIRKIFQHEFPALIGLAGLTGDLQQMQKADEDFAGYWGLLAEWSPDVRYEACDPTSAQMFVQAVADPNSGVFSWIKTHW